MPQIRWIGKVKAAIKCMGKAIKPQTSYF